MTVHRFRRRNSGHWRKPTDRIYGVARAFARDVEDQVTYPLTASLMGIPGVRTVRSSSAFGFSSLYVIFEDDASFIGPGSHIGEAGSYRLVLT